MTVGTILALVVATGSLLVSLYAARGSRAALAWQKQRDLERRTPSIAWEFRHYGAVGFVGMWSIDDPDPRPDPHRYQVEATIFNQGETTERIHTILVVAPDGAELEVTQQIPSPDFELKPRSPLAVTFRAGDGSKFAESFKIRLRLGSGEWVESPTEQVDAAVEAEIAAHNRTARPR